MYLHHQRQKHLFLPQVFAFVWQMLTGLIVPPRYRKAWDGEKDNTSEDLEKAVEAE